MQREIHNHYDFFPHAVSGACTSCFLIPWDWIYFTSTKCNKKRKPKWTAVLIVYSSHRISFSAPPDLPQDCRWTSCKPIGGCQGLPIVWTPPSSVESPSSKISSLLPRKHADYGSCGPRRTVTPKLIQITLGNLLLSLLKQSCTGLCQTGHSSRYQQEQGFWAKPCCCDTNWTLVAGCCWSLKRSNWERWDKFSNPRLNTFENCNPWLRNCNSSRKSSMFSCTTYVACGPGWNPSCAPHFLAASATNIARCSPRGCSASNSGGVWSTSKHNKKVNNPSCFGFWTWPRPNVSL